MEKEVGLGKPQSQFFKGYFVSRGFGMLLSCERSRAKKASQAVCLPTFFLSMRGTPICVEM